MNEGCFVPIDLQKAFDSVAHSYATTFFELMCLPPEIIRLLLLLSLLKLFLLGMGYLFDNIA